MNKIVVFTGAGISAESGIKTFRDSDGLWEEHDINEVATPEAWQKNPTLVLEFYNQRRKQMLEAKPNKAHLALKQLEKKFDVQIITQNIDHLHERAGSTQVLHLHGEIMKSRSTVDPNLIYAVEEQGLKMGDVCQKKSQLRPHIVWFGELVPNMEIGYEMAQKASIFIVVGTSLNVYPAAGLMNYVPNHVPKYLIDPKASNLAGIKNLTLIKEKAGTALPRIVDELCQKY